MRWAVRPSPCFLSFCRLFSFWRVVSFLLSYFPFETSDIRHCDLFSLKRFFVGRGSSFCSRRSPPLLPFQALFFWNFPNSAQEIGWKDKRERGRVESEEEERERERGSRSSQSSPIARRGIVKARDEQREASRWRRWGRGGGGRVFALSSRWLTSLPLKDRTFFWSRKCPHDHTLSTRRRGLSVAGKGTSRRRPRV